MSRRPLRSGAEVDVHCHRNESHLKPKFVAFVKRDTRRHERHADREELLNDIDEYGDEDVE